MIKSFVVLNSCSLNGLIRLFMPRSSAHAGMEHMMLPQLIVSRVCSPACNDPATFLVELEQVHSACRYVLTRIDRQGMSWYSPAKPSTIDMRIVHEAMGPYMRSCSGTAVQGRSGSTNTDLWYFAVVAKQRRHWALSVWKGVLSTSVTA